MESNPDLVVGGVKVKHHSLTFDQMDSVSAETVGDDYTIMLVTGIGRERVGDLARRTQIAGVRSFSLDPDYVPLSLAVGVRPEPEYRHPCESSGVPPGRQRFQRSLVEDV